MKWEAPMGGSADAGGVVLRPVRTACLRSDVRRGYPWGAKLGEEAQGPLFHPGVTGEEKTGMGERE